MSNLRLSNIQSNGTGFNDVVSFQNASGTENGTLCRAWVNFNGTGTVAIRADFNVDTITDEGTGDYTVIFTNGMVDANYAVSLNVGVTGTRRTISSYGVNAGSSPVTPTTTALRVVCFDESTTATLDMAGVSVAIFR